MSQPDRRPAPGAVSATRGPGAADAHAALGSGEAGRTFQLVREWEAKAALSDSQLEALERIAELCANRPLPDHLAESDDGAALSPTASAAQAATPSALHGRGHAPPAHDIAPGRLETPQDFFEWHTRLEAAWEAQEDGRYREHAASLGRCVDGADALLAAATAAAAELDAVEAGAEGVRATAASLDETCNRLVSERNQLESFASELAKRLVHFDRLDRLSDAVLHMSAQRLDVNETLAAAGDLVAAIAFLRAHAHYADAQAYLSRARQVEARLLGIVRFRAQTVLQQGTAAAHEEMARPATAGEERPRTAAAQAALLQARFRSVAEVHLKDLLSGLEALAEESPELAELLKDVRHSFGSARWESLRSSVEPAIAQLQAEAVKRGQAAAGPAPVPAKPSPAAASGTPAGPPANTPSPATSTPGSPDLVWFLRESLQFLSHVCRSELSLLAHFFPRAAAADPAACLEGLLSRAEQPLYDRARAAIVSVATVDDLCGFVDVLTKEFLTSDEAGVDDASPAALLRALVERILADARQRLTFRCQAFLRDKVVGYAPTEEDALVGQRLLKLPCAAPTPTPTPSPTPAHGDGQADPNGDEGRAEAATGQARDAVADSATSREAFLCPPVQATLQVLGRMHGRLAQAVFVGLASEAIQACLAAVGRLREAVAARRGPTEAWLAAVMNWMALRDRLASFKADLTVSDIDIDFSGMRSQLQRLFAGQLPTVGAGRHGGAVWDILVQGGIEVSERHMDPRRELDLRLGRACESLIAAVMRDAVEPLLGFLTAATAAQVSEGPSATRPLRDLDFARPDRVRAIVADTNARLRRVLPEVAGALWAFLPDPDARAVLARPIRGNVSEAMGQLTAVLWQEYAQGEVQELGLMGAEELAGLLGQLG